MAQAECGENWVSIADESQPHETTPTKQQDKSKSKTPQNKRRKSQKVKKVKEKQKCIWCDNIRERHDLCGRCRQKVESRARRIMLQKISGDWLLFDEIGQLVDSHCKNIQVSCGQLLSLMSQIGPFWVCDFISFINKM